MIVVVDYGVNNLRSVVRGLVAAGQKATLTSDPDEVRQADRVVVPGVGNYAPAMRTMTHSGLGEAIRSVGDAGRPVLGICLGMQLFFEQSEEAPNQPGLGMLPGQIRRFRTSLPIPHVGWAQVTPTAAGRRHGAIGPLWTQEDVFYYHVHSYHPTDVPVEASLATADYDGAFVTLVGRDNVLGAQFHPEKSQQAGIDLLGAFATWTP